jgi:hypothetical protein
VERAFAFDGTVTEVATTDLADPEGNSLGPIADVTFDVHEWYTGDLGRSFTIDMTPPVTTDHGSDSEWGQPYAVGTRLLVSGESRWGGGPSDAVAWGCGFSRYFSTEEASEWRTIFSAR